MCSKYIFLQLLLLFHVFFNSVNFILGEACNPRKYQYDSVVCVCNSTFCDIVENFQPLTSSEHAVIYTSTKDGQRFNKSTISWTEEKYSPLNALEITIDSVNVFQTIDGFGGSFTDAAGINIASLTKPTQNFLLDSYFSSKGIEYNMGRIPMACSDFSTRNYSYALVSNDFNLYNFALAEEDLQLKIPFIHRALSVSNRSLKFIGSPWSSPPWMKSNQGIGGKGVLIGQPGGKYYKTWAKYFVKFIEEYAKHNITMWAITAGNEPINGFQDLALFPCLGFTPGMQRDFLKYDLIPLMLKSGYDNVEIMIMDDRRFLLPKWAEIVLKDKFVAKHVKYIAVHWYTDDWAPIELLEETQELFPNANLIGTEACNGVQSKTKEFVKLGDWNRGEDYAQNIIETLNYGYTGWVDWNLALDLQGGPNWVDNFVDSPIIVNATADEFYKQPMFYVMGHFSKFLPEGSQRTRMENHFDKENRLHVLITSFKTAAYKLAVVLNKKGRFLNAAHVYINQQ